MPLNRILMLQMPFKKDKQISKKSRLDIHYAAIGHALAELPNRTKKNMLGTSAQ